MLKVILLVRLNELDANLNDEVIFSDDTGEILPVVTSNCAIL